MAECPHCYGQIDLRDDLLPGARVTCPSCLTELVNWSLGQGPRSDMPNIEEDMMWDDDDELLDDDDDDDNDDDWDLLDQAVPSWRS